MSRKRVKLRNDMKEPPRVKKRIRMADVIFGAVIVSLMLSAIYILAVPGDNGDDPYSSEDPNNFPDDDLNNIKDKDYPGGEVLGTNIGHTAPDFELTDTEGVKFSLSGHRGEVVLLDFMATWCGPCVTEMDHLKEVNANYYGRGVRVISIDVDDTETSQELGDFKTAHGCSWRFAAKGGAVGNSYGASSIPLLYIIDEQGVITFKNTGLTDYSILSSELDKLVGE